MRRQHSPLVLAVVRGVRSQILDGILTHGRRLPSERELSLQFHVSRAVVRKAVRILEDEGDILHLPNCRPVVAQKDQSRQELAHPSYRYLGIWIWPNMGDYGASMIIKGVQRAVKDPSLRLMISNAVGEDWDSRLASEREFLKRIAKDPHALGVITWYLGAEGNQPTLQALRDAKIPVVFIDRLPPKGFEADYVGTDNVGSSRQAVKHLIDLGHRRIAYVTNLDDVSAVHEREAGYRQALDIAGIEFDPGLLFTYAVGEDDHYEPEARRLVEAIMAVPDPPTAVCAVNDTAALTLYEAFTSKGIQVPGQMSVVGFDGLLRWLPSGGYLTSACQSFERIGEIAAELLLERSHSGTPISFRHVLLDAPLSDKGSTGRVSRALITKPLNQEDTHDVSKPESLHSH
ncbi:MAG: GntR family transcriptional regulator [Chlorobia bacterium]|nr:GntR family transcriptional regulator [Fimbriimonadaceae bacterium]